MKKLYCGSMFAGKSKSVIEEVCKSELAMKDILCVKPSLHTRDGDHIKSRSHTVALKCEFATTVEELKSLVDEKQPKMLVIDEVQFFDVSLASYIDTLKIDVVMGGLDTDFNRDDWKTTKALKEVVEWEKIYARCNVCDKPASWTSKIGGSKSTIELEGTATYEPRCDRHYEGR